MNAYQGWNVPQTFQDVLNQQDKRVRHEERRPQVTKASDILGPGMGPRAVLIGDWNGDITLFNGVFYSEPGSLHSPDDDAWWMGECWMNADGFGFQRVVNYLTADPAGDPIVTYVRRSYVVGGTRLFSAWTVV